MFLTVLKDRSIAYRPEGYFDNIGKSCFDKNITFATEFSATIDTGCEWNFGTGIPFFRSLQGGCYETNSLEATVECSYEEKDELHVVNTSLTMNLSTLSTSNFSICMRCAFAVPFCLSVQNQTKSKFNLKPCSYRMIMLLHNLS